MKKRKLKNWPIVLLFFIIIFGILIYCVVDIKNSLTNKSGNKVKIVDSIKGYDYKVNDNDSKYFKKLFKKLKKTLEKSEVDEEKYATLVSELFVVDFFSLDSSLSKNDVGGTQFVYEDYQKDFQLYAKDGIYKYVESNIYGKRKQELPMVKKVEVTDIKQDTYKNKKETDNSAYYVSVKVTYEKDLEYQTVANLKLIHKNNKLEIAEME